MENLFVKKDPLQDLLSSLNSVVSTNERNVILTDHEFLASVIMKSTKLKPPLICDTLIVFLSFDQMI